MYTVHGKLETFPIGMSIQFQQKLGFGPKELLSENTTNGTHCNAISTRLSLQPDHSFFYMRA